MLWAVVAACGDEHSEAVTELDASVTIRCDTDPDGATALGVRGVELWEAFVGTYTVAANRPRSDGSFQEVRFTITVARSQDPAPGLDDCSQVAVPVEVRVQSADPALDESVVGVLRGSLVSADVAFATMEYVLGFEPHLYGSLLFVSGQPLQMRLRTDDRGSWVAPPLQETP